MARAGVVWGVGVTAYAVAVLQRTSLGVVGIAAAQRFDVSPGVLSIFISIQLFVYVAAQIPAGVLVDRYGSKAVITSGMFLMAAGQILMAFTQTMGPGIVARVIVGAGDAFLFGSVLRLVPSWFDAKWVPLLMQLTGFIGALGQIVSAVAFLPLHQFAGWQIAFLTAAVVCVLSATSVLVFVKDHPDDSPDEPRGSAKDIGTQISSVWTHPATRLGLWTHLATGFAPMIFAMMWGIPYLTQGEGVSTLEASSYYTLLVISGAFAGPLLGMLTARHPLRRSNLAFFVIAANALPWLAVIMWPGPAPAWLLIVLIIGLSTGGPGSGIGFDYPRTLLPANRLGTANGIVIIGAFAGTVIGTYTIGALLDWLAPTGTYTLTDFRLAMLAQVPIWVFGLVAMLISRRKLRSMMALEGVVVPPWRVAIRREWLRQRYGWNQKRAGGSGGGA